MSIWNKFYLTENVPVSFYGTVKNVHITDFWNLIMLFGYSPFFIFEEYRIKVNLSGLPRLWQW